MDHDGTSIVKRWRMLVTRVEKLNSNLAIRLFPPTVSSLSARSPKQPFKFYVSGTQRKFVLHLGFRRLPRFRPRDSEQLESLQLAYRVLESTRDHRRPSRYFPILPLLDEQRKVTRVRAVDEPGPGEESRARGSRRAIGSVIAKTNYTGSHCNFFSRLRV